MWLGYLDSNQGMPASKAGALPLGDSPTNLFRDKTQRSDSQSHKENDGAVGET